uniref:Centrosomal protein of 135 kDa n=1 Tax=Schistosoma mansoni TaxID=6183 RepID=A0A5K4F561_SCHMA
MTGTYATAQAKFTKLRKRLDQLGYKQPLGLDSLPLVERLFYDLVWTTENLRKVRSELSSQIQIRSTVEDYIAPYKADNGKLIRENNEINHHLMVLRQDYEENIRGLKGECRRLENENEDMKYFNSQCLDKIHNYEREAKRMIEQILYLQEKNFQAVVYTPDGGKKQLPFRRQRMDIDSLVPPSKEAKTLNNENYCCSIAKIWEKANVEGTPKVILRDSEIERLRSISERGRPLEAVLNDSTEKQSDKLIQQLQIQVDLLQTRNAELESRIVDLMNREIPVMPSSVDKECQTTAPFESILVNNSSQTNSMYPATFNEYDFNSAAEFKKKICNAIEKFENDRIILTRRLRSIIIQNQKFTNELSSYIRSSVVGNRSIRISEQIIKSIEKYVKTIEGNQYRWESEIEVVAYTLKCISGYFQEKYFETTTDDINHLTDNKDKMELDSQLQLQRSKSTEINIDQLQDCKNSLEDEMKCLRQERNDLVSLLDHFERQLHNIKGNVRVLTHERDVLKHELLLQSEQINKISCHQLPSNQHVIDHSQSSVQSMNQAIDTELSQTVQNLQFMTTERNSLRDQLHNLTIEYNNEKNHLLQCLENNKNELNEVKQSKVSLEQRIAELIKSIVDKENECDRLIEKVNCLEKHQSNTDQVLFVQNNLQAVQSQLEKVQADYEKSRNEYTSLHVTLRQIDQEKDHLQICLDERTERCLTLERQLVTNETKKRILRLTQSVIERESENRELVERLSKSECDLKSTMKNHELLTKELEKAKNEMNILISEKQRLQSELNASYDKQSELDGRLVDCNKELTNLRDTSTLKEQERTDLLKEYRTLALQLDGKVTLINRLENQLNELNYKYSTLDKESLDLRQQLQHQQKECHDYAQVVQSLEVQSELLKRTTSDSENRIKRLQIENEEIHHDLTNARNLCDNLERQKNSLQHQYTISSFETNQTKAKLIETERELVELRKQVDREREAMKSFEFVLGSSREAEHTAHLELKECHAELSSLRERLAKTEAKLLDSESEAKTLQRQLLSLQETSQNHSSPSMKAQKFLHSSSDTYDEKHLESDLFNGSMSPNIDPLPSPTSSIELPTDYSTKGPTSSPVPCLTFSSEFHDTKPNVILSSSHHPSELISCDSSMCASIADHTGHCFHKLTEIDHVSESVTNVFNPLSTCKDSVSMPDLNFSQGDDSGRPVSENTVSNEQ